MVQYQSPAGKSDLEIVRSYEQALTKLGFTRLFSCGTSDCGSALMEQLYPSPEAPNLMAPNWNSTLHYTLWKGTREGTQYTVAVGAVNTGSAPGAYEIDVVEHTAMAKDSVTIYASQMDKSIHADGHIALYGILFDTNSTALKPESVTTLTEIAKLLTSEPSLKVAVVGHTDTQGAWAANMDLSRRRAEAVVHELSTKYSIPAARVMSVGVGAAAPIADNKAEAGRTKNRRVDLVELP